MWTLSLFVKCREQADTALVSSDESVDGEDYFRRNMILIPDSSEQDALSTSPAPASMIPVLPSNDILGSLHSQTVDPYDSIQFPNRRLNSSMPTMDSTVSSAKPEPELNIGMLHCSLFFFSVFYFFTTACRYYKRDGLKRARERKTGGIAGRDSG